MILIAGGQWGTLAVSNSGAELRSSHTSRTPSFCVLSVQDIALKQTLTHARIDRRPKVSTLQTIVVVCLAVLLLFALVHVAVGHSTATAADNCPLCAVMHSLAPFVVMAIALVLMPIEAPAPDCFEVRAIIRQWPPSLFNRPPPATC
jgi:hydrogenase-4 membrane subunit HyfE